jgi:hypothetical protein
MAPGTGKTLVKCHILSPAIIYIYESIKNKKNVLPVNPKKERVRILVTDNRKLGWKREEVKGRVLVHTYSNEDNILQEDSKTAPSVTANVEALTNDTAKDELIYKEPRTSKRQKKPPAIRSDDFYGK